MPIIQLVKERAVALNLMTESSTFRSNDGDQEAGGEDIEERVLDKTESRFKRSMFDILAYLRDWNPFPCSNTDDRIRRELSEISERSFLRVNGPAMYHELSTSEHSQTDVTIYASGVPFHFHRFILDRAFPDLYSKHEGTDTPPSILIDSNPDLFKILHVYAYTADKEEVQDSLKRLIAEDRPSRKRIIWDFAWMIVRFCGKTDWQRRELVDVLYQLVCDTA